MSPTQETLDYYVRSWLVAVFRLFLVVFCRQLFPPNPFTATKTIPYYFQVVFPKKKGRSTGASLTRGDIPRTYLRLGHRKHRFKSLQLCNVAKDGVATAVRGTIKLGRRLPHALKFLQVVRVVLNFLLGVGVTEEGLGEGGRTGGEGGGEWGDQEGVASGAS